MKVKKQDLEELTVDAAKIGVLGLALLAKTHCPIPELYEFLEKFTVKVDNLRENLELKRICPKEIGEGLLSKSISELTEMQELEEKFGSKGPIGFQVPDPNDRSKMN